MLIGYARTSTTDQEAGFADQRRRLKEIGCEEMFEEQVSAVAEERPKLEEMITFARKGDVVCVVRVDRLARSVSHLLSIIKRLEAKGVGFRALEFGTTTIDTSKPSDMMLLTILGAVSEFERSLMLERQKVGIEQARKDGKYKGRAATARAKAGDIMALRAKGKTGETIADMLEISRASVFRVLKAHGKTRPADATSPV